MSRTSPSNPTQHPGHNSASTEVPQSIDSPEERRSQSQDRTTNALRNQTTVPFLHPFNNPLYYWPYPQMVYFLPFPVATAYYFQQPVMGIPVHTQPTPFGISPSIAPITQNINTGPITNNFVTTIETGTDNSTNVEINKNGDRTRNGSTRIFG